MTEPRELLSQRPASSAEFARLNASYGRRRFITVIVMLALIGAIGYYAYVHRAPPNPADIPVIKADTTPYKQKPENPGGIDIPHQDVQVYDQLDGSDAPGNGVEHLLPPPEAPQPVPVQTSPVKDVTPPIVQDITPPDARQSPAPATVIPPATRTTTIESLMGTAPPPVTTVSPVPSSFAPAATPPAPVVETMAPPPQTVTPVTPPAPAPSPAASAAPAKTTPRGGAVIQLSAVTDAALAQADMERLQARYQSILDGVPLRVVKADLGARGVYYRIQGQPVDEATASRICSAIKQSHAGCIIVRP